MNVDCIIIGGGISGLTCGIRCAENGLSCAIISAGMNALHFSSGSIDLLGFHPGKNIVFSPFDELNDFIHSHPRHPYSKYGRDVIEMAISYFDDQVNLKGIELFSNKKNNHFHVTSLGTLKPSFLSQKSVFNQHIMEAFQNNPGIAIINMEGFRDFYPEMVASNLKKNSLFNRCKIVTGSIQLPDSLTGLKNNCNLRSIDISRIFDMGSHIDEIADQIKKIAGNSKIAGIPAFLGIYNSGNILSRLCDLTGLFIYEIPTLPPSILGMRLDNALKSRFADLGGVYIAGDRVKKGYIKNNRVDYIITQNNPDTHLTGTFYVLATGSFFSGGMISESESIKEPVFDLIVEYTKNRKTWYSHDFFHPAGHPFFNFGVNTNDQLNPFDNSGKTIKNLYCSGAILSHYDPVTEGTGGGVAVSSGYYAADRILNHS